MTPAQELDTLTRCFPSAYPNSDVALAWLLCVPGAGYGWVQHDGVDQIFGESYTQKKVAPVKWEMFADGDNTVRQYINCFTSKTPLAQVPDTADQEWVVQCLRGIDLAKKVGVDSKVLTELEAVEVDLKARFPNALVQPKKIGLDSDAYAKLKERVAKLSPEEKTAHMEKYREFNGDVIRGILTRKDCEATFRTPKIEAAIAAIEACGAEYLFEQLDRESGIRWRVVVRHKNDPHNKDDLWSRLEDSDSGHLEKEAKKLLSPAQFTRWCENDAWQKKTRKFGLSGGESSYGSDAELLFYNGMVNVFSGPWTWPLIDRAVEIFGEPIVEGPKMTFTPLPSLYHYNHGTLGIVKPRKVFPYKYDNWLSGSLPAYKPSKCYTYQDLVDGIVVSFNGRRYRVSYPLVQKLIDEGATGVGGGCSLEYGEYPDPSAEVTFEETTAPLTKPTADGPVQFFGLPQWTQSDRYAIWKGQAGHNLFTLHDGWGDGGTTNLLFCMDEDGRPVRVFHEASCS